MQFFLWIGEVLFKKKQLREFQVRKHGVKNSNNNNSNKIQY